MGKAKLLLTLGPMLPITLVSDLVGAIGQAMARVGVTGPTITSGLEVYAVIPPADQRPEYHEITLLKARGHQVAWLCSCGDAAPAPYAEVGDATGFAVEHVPPGEAWSVVPARALWASKG